MKSLKLAERFQLARKTARERQGLEYSITQADLADLIGVSRISIYNIERNITKKPKDSTLEGAARALRVNYAWLERGEGSMDPELEDYPLPEMKTISAANTAKLMDNQSNTKYSFTPVIVIESSETNKDWQCIFPDLDGQQVITTAVIPSLDYQTLKSEPLFNADVFITRDERGMISGAYILNVYFGENAQ